jgi:hypothetical protein
MDCGVEVFRALTKLTRAEIVKDMPEAVNGKTVDERIRARAGLRMTDQR